MATDKSLVTFSVDPATGAPLLRLGEGLPDAIRWLFPSLDIKHQITHAIADDIEKKIRRKNSDFTDAEIEFVRSAAGRLAARVICERQVAARALMAMKANTPKLFEAGAKQPTVGRTVKDLITKFWEDAGLVSDDDVQEFYAQVLADEGARPGSCSMQTLGVLKYLDHETAHIVDKVAPLVIDGRFVTRNAGANGAVPGANYDDMLTLDDAGLLGSSGTTTEMIPAGQRYVLTWGPFALSLECKFADKLPTYPLSRAGRDLFRVAHVDRSPETFFWVANRVRECFFLGSGNGTVAWAPLPVVPETVWREVPPATPPPTPAPPR